MGSQPSRSVAPTAPTIDQPTKSLRAKVALCGIIAFFAALLSAYAPGTNKFIVVVCMAGVCGTLLDFPDDLSLHKISAYCIPIGIFFFIGLSIWFGEVGRTEERGVYYYVSLTLAAYLLLIASGVARSSIVNLFSQIYGFILSSREAGIRLGSIGQVLIVIVLMIFGVKVTNLGDILLAIFK